MHCTAAVWWIFSDKSERSLRDIPKSNWITTGCLWPDMGDKVWQKIRINGSADIFGSVDYFFFFCCSTGGVVVAQRSQWSQAVSNFYFFYIEAIFDLTVSPPPRPPRRLFRAIKHGRLFGLPRFQTETDCSSSSSSTYANPKICNSQGPTTRVLYYTPWWLISTKCKGRECLGSSIAKFQFN